MATGAPPAYANGTAYQNGTPILYCIERGVNAGEYAHAVIVEKNATFATTGDTALEYLNKGSQQRFYIPSSTYDSAATAGTWKPIT